MPGTSIRQITVKQFIGTSYAQVTVGSITTEQVHWNFVLRVPSSYVHEQKNVKPLLSLLYCRRVYHIFTSGNRTTGLRDFTLFTKLWSIFIILDLNAYCIDEIRVTDSDGDR